jgi:P-type Cu+ transporter
VSYVNSSRQAAALLKRSVCAHCGAPSPSPSPSASGGRTFCCVGCRAVFELLGAAGLDAFYRWEPQPGRVPAAPSAPGRYAFLDSDLVQSRLLDFADGETARVRFRLPAIHCVACVWLLERLHKLEPAVLAGRVDFPRQSVQLTYDPRRMRLSDLAALLDRLGYAPDLRLADMGEAGQKGAGPLPGDRRMWARIGVAGFAFGNTMFMALPGYFGFDRVDGLSFQRWFGWISLAFAVPVATWCAEPYWKSAWISWRTRRLGLDTPIVLGIVALFAQSACEVVRGGGLAYLDSLSALIFFLLCGRWFQQRTFDRIAFDRDYRSFFPLAVSVIDEAGERTVSLGELKIGDKLRIRNGELIPADARLLSGEGAVDYSFVTGESAPVACSPGARVHAGGRQSGASIDVVIEKPVSQSYLASLWDQEVFQKRPADMRQTLVDWLGRRFAIGVFVAASASALAWLFIRPAEAAGVFAAVLIVACPCALALAGPMAYGTAQRRLARRGIFAKGPRALETLAHIDHVVLDKTGTLTDAGEAEANLEGLALTALEKKAVASVAAQSIHPVSRAVCRALGCHGTAEISGFEEQPGRGVSGISGGLEVRLGAASWVGVGDSGGSGAWLSINGAPKGFFRMTSPMRKGIANLPARLKGFRLALLSGDGESEAGRFRAWLGEGVPMRFRQSPADKLGFVAALGKAGGAVMMVGDGLNDAGALQHSDLGVAVVGRIGAFSPASDVVMEASSLGLLPNLLAYGRRLRRSVRIALALSTMYNLCGVGLAAAGRLSPVVTAVLMPLSSATVVLAACGLAAWEEHRAMGRARRGA